jgi:hypothetical protein
VLLVGSMAGPLRGTEALLIFAAATALTMGLVSAGFAHLLAKGRIKARLADLVPFFAAASLMFGVWYSLSAISG